MDKDGTAALETETRNHQKIEEALRSSEERFRIAAECSTDLIWEWDMAKGTLAWFGKIDEMLGYTPGGFPRTIEAWEQVIHPDDHDRVMEALNRHLKDREPYCVKYRFLKQDGSSGYWIDRGMAFTDAQGSPYKMIGACSDITEREKAEQALRESREDLNRAQAVAHIGSWRLLIQTNKLLCSEECYRIFGIPVGTPMTYRKFLTIVHPEDREQVDRAWKAALAGEPYNIEHRLVAGDTVKWVHEQAELEFDPQGKLLSGFGTTQDITARKQLEEEREQLLVQLVRSNRELEQFAYVASHDLQEPLRMVASFTRLLERRYKDKLDQDAREFINYAVDGALRMQKLIDDLLAYSRVGARDIPFEPTDCNHLLKQALCNLRVAIEENQAVITSDALPTITCNASQMAQLFQNLISNAIKFRGAETPRIHISAQYKQDEWLFSLQDNGIGIDPRYKEQVFKIFQRLHSRDEYAGTGIGLALCMKIVELHKGKIWLESELGKGSTFYFTLPA
jgi:PAS domain S-box-containing protein